MTRSSRRYAGEWVVSRLLADRADTFGDDVFSTDRAGEQLSFGALADRAGRMAAVLRSAGIGEGAVVATMLEPGHDYLGVWFGCAWAGCIEVPVNTDLKGPILEHVLNESGAQAIVIDARWAERLDAIVTPGLEVRLLVGGDRPAPSKVRSLELAPAMHATDAIAPTARAETDPVYVMFTSGTSGPSKGAVHSNRSALWNAVAWLDVLDLGDDDVAYSMFPLFHVTARSAVVTSTMWAGGRVALRNGFSVSGFWEDVVASEATFFAYMGSVIHLLGTAAPSDLDRAHRVRRAFGAAAPPAMVAEFEQRFGFPLLEVYGSTELGLATAPQGGVRVAGTMGTECPHVELAIAAEDGTLLPTGEQGEIVARPRVPHGIFQGYWRRPEATVEAWRDLWFHTGDRGYVRDDGNLVFVDRVKDCIRRRGENISSFEVERAVQHHPDVVEAAAYAVPSDIAEEEVAVAVVLRDGADLDAAAFFAFCIEHLPRFAVPRYVRTVDALPKTPSQRVQKYLLRGAGVTDDTADRQQLGIVVPKS